jgi:hypothetical protein
LLAKRAVDDALHGIAMSKVKNRHPQPAIVLCFEVVQDALLAHGHCDAMAAGQKFLGQETTKTRRAAGNEIGLRHNQIPSRRF